MAEFTRPAFISAEAWENATDGAKEDWHNYARALGKLAEDPDFRAVTSRWIDEVCGVAAGTIDEAELAQAPRADLLLALREGKRQAGVTMMQHIQAVAPKMWMRAMHEAKNARVRVGEGE